MRTAESFSGGVQICATRSDTRLPYAASGRKKSRILSLTAHAWPGQHREEEYENQEGAAPRATLAISNPARERQRLCETPKLPKFIRRFVYNQKAGRDL